MPASPQKQKEFYAKNGITAFGSPKLVAPRVRKPIYYAGYFYCGFCVARFGGSQNWNVNYTAKTIKNAVSNICLTDSGASLVDGNPIWIEACNDSNAQQWAAPPMNATNSVR